jgi:transglutaminase-like putative cysteine protease
MFMTVLHHRHRLGQVLAACALLVSPGRLAASEATEFETVALGSDMTGGTRRHVRYEYVVRNTANEVSRDARIWLPAPVRRTSTQICLRLRISRDASLLTDEHENQGFCVTYDHIPPLGQAVVAVDAWLLLKEPMPSSLPSGLIHAYTSEQQYVESSAPRIVSRAESFPGESVNEVARSIYDWVANHMQTTGRFRAPLGALYALEHADGDCSEYAFLFTALCRARAIPARCMTGFVRGQDARLSPAMRHGWAEFYDGECWQIADSQLRAFGTGAKSYIAMRVTADTDRIPLKAQQLSRTSAPNLRLVMMR